jgi:hypothetical protein
MSVPTGFVTAFATVVTTFTAVVTAFLIPLKILPKKPMITSTFVFPEREISFYL